MRSGARYGNLAVRSRNTGDRRCHTAAELARRLESHGARSGTQEDRGVGMVQCRRFGHCPGATGRRCACSVSRLAEHLSCEHSRWAGRLLACATPRRCRSSPDAKSVRSNWPASGSRYSRGPDVLDDQSGPVARPLCLHNHIGRGVIALGAAFLLVEARQANPVLPLDLLFRPALGFHLQNLARVPFAHPVARFQILHQRAAPRGLYHFFRRTSCSIVLSSVSSATNCFSFVFSSRSCLT